MDHAATLTLFVKKMGHSRLMVLSVRTKQTNRLVCTIIQIFAIMVAETKRLVLFISFRPTSRFVK